MQQETMEIEIPASPCRACGSIRWSLTSEFKATMLGTWARVTARCGKCAASSTTYQNLLSPVGKLWCSLKELATGRRSERGQREHQQNGPEAVIAMARWN